MQQLLDWCEDIPPEPVSVSKEDAATYVTPFARDLLYEIVHPEGARVIAVSGGVGCGKSYAIAQAVKTVCLTRPKSHVLVSAGSLTLLMSVLKKRCDEVFGHLAEFKGGVLHPHYLFANGSVAEFRPYTCHGNSAESSNSWEGRDACLLIVDERVAPETVIETPDGPRAILDLALEGYTGEVLGFNHATGKPEWTQVKHSKVYSDTRKSYRLAFDDGTTLDATENHPIWVDGVGYVTTKDIFGAQVLRFCYTTDTKHGESSNESDHPGYTSRRQLPFDAREVYQSCTSRESFGQAKSVCGAQGSCAAQRAISSR